MKKPRIQTALASLSPEEKQRLADWLRHGHYDDVLERIKKPRSEGGLGLSISKKPLQTFYAKVALMDLINPRLPDNLKLTITQFESLSAGDTLLSAASPGVSTLSTNPSIHLSTNPATVQNPNPRSAIRDPQREAVHAAILQTTHDLATSGDNSPAQLLQLQRLADFPARAEFRALKEQRQCDQHSWKREMQTHKIQMDLHRKETAEHRKHNADERLALAKRLVELREKLSQKSKQHPAAKTPASKLHPSGWTYEQFAVVQSVIDPELGIWPDQPAVQITDQSPDPSESASASTNDPSIHSPTDPTLNLCPSALPAVKTPSLFPLSSVENSAGRFGHPARTRDPQCEAGAPTPRESASLPTLSRAPSPEEPFPAGTNDPSIHSPEPSDGGSTDPTLNPCPSALSAVKTPSLFPSLSSVENSASRFGQSASDPNSCNADESRPSPLERLSPTPARLTSSRRFLDCGMPVRRKAPLRPASSPLASGTLPQTLGSRLRHPSQCQWRSCSPPHYRTHFPEMNNRTPRISTALFRLKPSGANPSIHSPVAPERSDSGSNHPPAFDFQRPVFCCPFLSCATHTPAMLQQLATTCLWLLIASLYLLPIRGEDLRVGAASVDLQADDSMIIAGGITSGKAVGQEGRLRCIATVLEKDRTRLAIVARDVLMMTRQTLDPVMSEIERMTGIPAANILINCTHTHHAPSTMRVHGYGADETFTREVQRAIVTAVQNAATNLAPANFYFGLGELKNVGQNSRLLLDDGQIFWIGPRTNVVRPTGPFDPDLPVLAFRDEQQKLLALIFNHSTHSIGTRTPGKRSASIYGLATQDLETELGGTITFLEGASGSTHNLDLTGAECTRRISDAVRETLQTAQLRPVPKLLAKKHPLKFRVRTFDDAAEDTAIERYCRKYSPQGADTIIKVFRDMRRDLASHQGEERQTWLQVLCIGDVAIVGVPAEYFTQLGLDIKNRSPFRYTCIAELANDWIGYLPNFEGHKLGGYQVWTGFHSYAEPGTGERIADEAVAMLKELKNETLK